MVLRLAERPEVPVRERSILLLADTGETASVSVEDLYRGAHGLPISVRGVGH